MWNDKVKVLIVKNKNSLKIKYVEILCFKKFLKCDWYKSWYKNRNLNRKSRIFEVNVINILRFVINEISILWVYIYFFFGDEVLLCSNI